MNDPIVAIHNFINSPERWLPILISISISIITIYIMMNIVIPELTEVLPPWDTDIRTL